MKVGLSMQMGKKYGVNFGSTGFTLIEMIITLVLITIFATIAIPSYRGIMQSMRVSALSNDFIAALAFARAEAVKRNNYVSICPAADSTFSTCGTSSSWANGWIVFVDVNNNGIIASSSNILKTHDALIAGSTIVTTLNYVEYNRSGFLGSTAGSLTLTVPGCTGNSAVLITLSITGWASVTQTACTMA